jgi:hypothetical protein
LLGLPWPALANADAIAGLKRWGSGEFRRYGFLVYAATLWAGDDPQRPPLALRLDYQRSIAGKAIAAASVQEMRRFVSDETLLQHWGEQMQRIFPDVEPGDHLLGVYDADGARFYQDDRLLGTIAAPGFAAAFFAIWLDADACAAVAGGIDGERRMRPVARCAEPRIAAAGRPGELPLRGLPFSRRGAGAVCRRWPAEPAPRHRHRPLHPDDRAVPGLAIGRVAWPRRGDPGVPP